MSSPESLEHQMTHKGVPVNWRPYNLEPKTRALTASCLLSADTLPEHTHSHNKSYVSFERIGQQLDMTGDVWVMYAYTLNTLMLVSRVCFPRKLLVTQALSALPN